LNHQLNDLDRRIIDILRDHGRRSNREVARRLGTSESTVSTHIKRLLSEKLLEIVAVRNLATVEDATLVFVGISAERARIAQVAEALRECPEVHFAAIVLGRFDILASLVVADRANLYQVLREHIAGIPGVLRTETMEGLVSVKTFAHQTVVT